MRSQNLLSLSIIFFATTASAFALTSFGSVPTASAARIAPPRQSNNPISAAPAVTYTLNLPVIFRSCATTQLLQDTSFEAGLPNAFWTNNYTSTILDNSAIPNPNPTHSGSWKAFLGGNVSTTETLWQNVTVPSGTSSLSVSFWRRIDTFESTPFPIDLLHIQVRDSISTTLQTVYTLSNFDAGTTWDQITRAITPTYASQNIQLAFVATNDSSLPTSFFIDDVTLSACQ